MTRQQRETELNKLVHDFPKLVAIYRQALGMPRGPTPTPTATATEMIKAILAKEFPEKK